MQANLLCKVDPPFKKAQPSSPLPSPPLTEKDRLSRSVYSLCSLLYTCRPMPIMMLVTLNFLHALFHFVHQTIAIGFSRWYIPNHRFSKLCTHQTVKRHIGQFLIINNLESKVVVLTLQKEINTFHVELFMACLLIHTAHEDNNRFGG